MKRVTVQVDSERLESGEIVPIRITWQDGRVSNQDYVAGRTGLEHRQSDSFLRFPRWRI